MRITLILVAPARAENVGAAARAMKTMGFNNLRIVASQVHHQPAARALAHGATEILDNCQHFATLEQALADVELTIACTARLRGKFHYYLDARKLLPTLEEKSHWTAHTALVFGREASGLTNQELALADILTTVPMNADYPSLNLGQAVMVYCYQLAPLWQRPINAPIPPAEPLQALRQRCHRLLTRLNVADDEKLADWINQRLATLEIRDVAMLHRLLADIEKRLPDA